MNVKTNTARLSLLFMKNLFFLIICLTSLACKKVEVKTKAIENQPIAQETTKITFDKNVQAILVTQCAPCHMPGGDRINKWDTFAKAKTYYTAIANRVQRKTSDEGFMPKNGSKLSQNDINIILKWEKDGFLEK